MEAAAGRLDQVTVTIRQIAEASGVHTSSVSRILNGKVERYGISRHAEAKVLAAARSLGYRPNAAAKATATGRFNAAALLQTQRAGRSTLPEPLLSGLCDELADRDMHLSLARLPDEQFTEQRLVPRILRVLLADGLLVNYTDHIPETMMSLLRRDDLPSVWMNAKLPFDCVRPDDYGAARQATKRLIGLGHRRIAYLDFAHRSATIANDHYSAREREAGYADAMIRAGLAPDIVRFDRPTPDNAALQWATAWVRGPDRPTATVGYGRVESTVVLMAALYAGLRPGTDISAIHLSTLGPPLAGRMGGLDLSHMAADHPAIAREAVAMLCRRIEQPDRHDAPCVVPFIHQRGQTIGPPARKGN